MATPDPTTPAAAASTVLTFDSRARADGYLDEDGFFIGPQDIEAELSGLGLRDAQQFS